MPKKSSIKKGESTINFKNHVLTKGLTLICPVRFTGRRDKFILFDSIFPKANADTCHISFHIASYTSGYYKNDEADNGYNPFHNL